MSNVMIRRGIALMCVIAAVLAHWAFCEWRTIEYTSESAGDSESRILYSVRVVHHPEGNAKAWDGRQEELRRYHVAWIDCWVASDSPLASDPACAQALMKGKHPTQQAVELAACEAPLGSAAPSHSPDFRACLGSQGYPDVRAPMWTFDSVGARFEGPYLTRTALFAEALSDTPAVNRAFGWGMGILLPIALLVMAGLLVTGLRPDERANRSSRPGGTQH